MASAESAPHAVAISRRALVMDRASRARGATSRSAQVRVLPEHLRTGLSARVRALKVHRPTGPSARKVTARAVIARKAIPLAAHRAAMAASRHSPRVRVVPMATSARRAARTRIARWAVARDREKPASPAIAVRVAILASPLTRGRASLPIVARQVLVVPARMADAPVAVGLLPVHVAPRVNS
jgi:hypothetical protein